MFQHQTNYMTRALVTSIVIIMACVMSHDVSGSDDLEQLLRRHELNELLAVHLEDQFERATSDERETLVVELADIYAVLLEQTDDPDVRDDYEQRGRALLDVAPPQAGDQLRLALRRAPYRRAEDIAERYRIRSASKDEIEEARDIFRSSADEFLKLRDRFKQKVRSIENRQDRAVSEVADQLEQERTRVQQLADECLFLGAWSTYYLAWLNDDARLAQAATMYFGELLDPENPILPPQDVSVDLREIEFVARSILGMALSKSICNGPEIAAQWLLLLDHDESFGPLREQLPIWEIYVHLEHGEFREALLRLRPNGGAASRVPVTWVRLAAVWALESRKSSNDATSLAQYAITLLASYGELDQVFDLAQQFGADALGTSGFASQYVKGVLSYRDARTTHDGEYPTTDPRATRLYTEAEEQFSSARAEPDAAAFGGAQSAALRLIGLCRYFTGRYLDARDALVQASAELPSEEAAEALWMAIVCLDQVVIAGGQEDLQKELEALIEQFLEAYPSSQYAPKLVLRRAAMKRSSLKDRATDIEDLLAIPENSDVYADARRRAAFMLFELYRATSREAKADFGNRYLDVALPLLSTEAANLDPEDDDQIQKHLGRLRRIAEVALSTSIERVGAARAAISEYQRLAHSVDLPSYGAEPEMRCRRIQFQLLTERFEEACQAADEAYLADPTDSWTIAANKAVFRDAVTVRRDKSEGALVDIGILQRIVTYGSRVIKLDDGLDPNAMSRSDQANQMAIASAAFDLFQQNGDVETGALGLRIYKQVLLVLYPKNVAFLQRGATLAQRLSDYEFSLSCWRTLTHGLNAEQAAWYEAKLHMIEVLLEIDPDRARAVMDQHKLLYPEFGPAPWGGMLKGLDETIDIRIGKPTGGSP